MKSDGDNLRRVEFLIQQHGDGAALHAAERADKLLDKGDLEGSGTWRRILKAIKLLTNDAIPRKRDTIH